MVKLNKIYTRTGDDGSTGLTDGSRVPKHSPRPQAYGSVDELNSMSKVSSPLQSSCEGIGSISIVGLTVTITSKLSPTQPLYSGVTVYVIVATFSEEFIKVWLIFDWSVAEAPPVIKPAGSLIGSVQL